MIGLGVIGCGKLGERFLRYLSDMQPTATLIAVADSDEGRARVAAGRYGASRWFSDYEQLLEQPDVQAVAIVTPNYLHAPMTIRAAAAGKHVLVIKPMAVTLEEADAMVAAAQRARVQLMVPFHRRFLSEFQCAQQLAQDGTIGRAYLVVTQFSHFGPYEYFGAATDWYFRPERSGGGALLDMGVHDADLVTWITGKRVARVFGQVGAFVHSISVDDTATLQLEMDDGGLGTILAGWGTQFDQTIQRVEVYGTEGTLSIHREAPLVRVYLRRTANRRSGWYYPDVKSVDPWAKLCEEFVAAASENRTPSSSGIDGRRALGLVLAAYQSAREGRPIALPVG
ncbi:MAG TPA: Gfo/Idh/MocA family oxidoreductase [bacterium]|nr:Gfo/Idh/MocA family oxidoreductase [bacterium]